MTAASTKQPLPAADVVAAMERAEGVLKAVRPLLKAKQITWGRVYDLLNMAVDELREPSSAIIDWQIERHHREAEAEA